MTAVDPNLTEPPLLAQTIELVQSLVDVPLCIDSSVPAALAAGLAVAKGRPLVNSVTGEEDRLETILPLIKKFNVPVVAISNDESGISYDPDVPSPSPGRSSNAPPTTASSPPTSWSTRW